MKNRSLLLLILIASNFLFADVYKVNQDVCAFLGGDWELVADSGRCNVAVVSDSEYGEVLKFTAKPHTWGVLRQKITGLQTGELIQVEMEVFSWAPNMNALISSGFLWGDANPKGKSYKVNLAGNGEWQKLKLSLRITKQPVSLGIGFTKREFPVSMLIKSIKISREKVVLQKSIAAAEKLKVNKDLPEIIRQSFLETQNSLIHLGKKLSACNGEEAILTAKKISMELKNMEQMYVLADGTLNPKIIKAVKGKAKIQIFNARFPHSVWCRVICKPNTGVQLFQNDGVNSYPLNEADLILIPMNASNNLEITAPAGKYDITLQPLDYIQTPVKKSFSCLF